MRPASGSPRWSASGAPWPPRTRPVLRGACDPLSSPRPLGPLVDVAPHLDPQVDELLRSGERDGLFEAALASLEAMSPVVLVIEDLHWADMSTLDLVRFLARRLEGTHVLVVATYRDDHLQPSDPLRVVLGDIASQSVVRRVEVPLLSPAAVAELAAESGIDAAALHRETGGNAFFVTEVVAAGGGPLPGTVQDAVLARVQRLSPLAQRALETAAVVGSRVEPALVHALPDVTTEAVDECVSAGMLRFEAPAYGFRHEIVRQAVLSGITPGRLGALHWQVLDRLRAMPMSPRPFARLAEHAEMAGDGPAILEFAVAAGDAAACLGSHREAAFQYGRAMPYAGLLDADDAHRAAQQAGRRVPDLRRPRARDRGLGRGAGPAPRRRSRPRRGRGAAGDGRVVLHDRRQQPRHRVRRRGAEPARRTWPRAGSWRWPSAGAAPTTCGRPSTQASLPWLERAIAMGREVGDHEVVSQALGEPGRRPLVPGRARGRPWSWSGRRSRSRSPTTSRTAPRGTTRRWPGLDWLDFDLVEAHAQLEEAERYTAERDLHGQLMCVLASEITLKVDMGRWDEAAAQAHDLLYVRNTGRASRIEPLVALGLLSARRGDADGVWGPSGRGARPHREDPVAELPGLHRDIPRRGVPARRGHRADPDRGAALVRGGRPAAGEEDFVADLAMLVVAGRTCSTSRRKGCASPSGSR